MKVSVHNNQRGIGHLIVVLLVVLVVAAAGIATWRIVEHQNKLAKRKTNSAAQNNCLDVYKDEKLCAFAAANADLAKTPYTVVVRSTTAQGQSTEMTIKSDGKGNTSTFSKNGNRTYNTITIGNTVYVQNGNNWIEYASNAPITGANVAGNIKAAFSKTGTPESKQIKYESMGREKCGQDTCYKYRVSNPARSGNTHIWINASSNRLVRLTTESSEGTTSYNVSYGPVTINAPSPVVSPSSALNPAQQAELQAMPSN